MPSWLELQARSSLELSYGYEPTFENGDAVNQSEGAKQIDQFLKNVCWGKDAAFNDAHYEEFYGKGSAPGASYEQILVPISLHWKTDPATNEKKLFLTHEERGTNETLTTTGVIIQTDQATADWAEANLPTSEKTTNRVRETMRSAYRQVCVLGTNALVSAEGDEQNTIVSTVTDPGQILFEIREHTGESWIDVPSIEAEEEGEDNRGQSRTPTQADYRPEPDPNFMQTGSG